ncbi:hypothetical protein B0H14DRAFT_3756808 [Mycena olivaceomarginata]|nr:hypothetical protein B0H14DRAFT_3756808 [Mycena olivaceomarginata]
MLASILRRRRTTSRGRSLSAVITDLALTSTSSACGPPSHFSLPALPLVANPPHSRAALLCGSQSASEMPSTRYRLCAWSRNPAGAHKPSHPALVLPPLPLSSKPALQCSTLDVSVSEMAVSRPDLSHTTRALRGTHQLGVQITAHWHALGSSPDLRSPALAARAAPNHLRPFLSFTPLPSLLPSSLDPPPPSSPDSSLSCRGAAPHTPIPTPRTSALAAGVIVLECVRTDSQRLRTCPSPTLSASLLSSTSVPLSGALRVAAPPPASILLPPFLPPYRIPLQLYTATQ